MQVGASSIQGSAQVVGILGEVAPKSYSDLAITPQAIRGGAEPGSLELTAWITMAVPPSLKTELGSEPIVTFGATTVAWPVPSAATISEKFGMSPAGMAVWSECAAPEGLK